MDVLERLTEVFRRVFDDRTLEISEKTVAQDIPDWDSLNHINLIIEIEDEFSMRLTVDDIADLANVGDMIVLIESKV